MYRYDTTQGLKTISAMLNLLLSILSPLQKCLGGVVCIWTPTNLSHTQFPALLIPKNLLSGGLMCDGFI